MRRALLVASAAVLSSLMLVSCGDAKTDSSGSSSKTEAGTGTVCSTTDAADDLLAEICDKGVLTVSTDPAYPPQSKLNAKTGEYEGFDIDVATEIAKRLGVDIAWEAPSWDVITAGSWNGRWDMSVGSMTPTNDRQKVLYFTDPYYYTPAVVVVHQDNTSVQDLSTDLDGKTIGVCSGCTYDQYLQKTLAIKGFTFDFIIDDAVIKGYDTDTTALQDLALGDGNRLDAVITSSTTAQGYVDAGNPVKIVGDPVFYEPLSAAFDKSSEKDSTSLAEAANKIVADMHADGTLSNMSKKWYDGLDLTVQN
ncbi:MAG: transporter substrate-binding domain-containing protein [Nocardioides sp.]|uniref:transporter substrate-binding domain-containing protein n=1 Tax=Nocardioides sp. TaxID=35761 RepID=UPI0039E422E7